MKNTEWRVGILIIGSVVECATVDDATWTVNDAIKMHDYRGSIFGWVRRRNSKSKNGGDVYK